MTNNEIVEMFVSNSQCSIIGYSYDDKYIEVIGDIANQAEISIGAVIDILKYESQEANRIFAINFQNNPPHQYF